MRANFRGRLVAALAACLVATPSLAAAPAVNAMIEPAQIAVGESAQLTVMASGSVMPPVTPPVVSGLDIRLAGQSRQIQSINGVAISTTSVIFRVTPKVAGIFTIPGLTPKSQPLVLRVTAASGTLGSEPPDSPRAQGHAAVTSEAGDRDIRLTPDGSAFVRLDLPKHEIYVGESIPVEIQVGMRNGFVSSLNGLPKLTANDFTLNNLSHQPERKERVIDGQDFTVFTWRSVLAAVKPGTFSLSVETPLTVRIRTRPIRETTIDDLLGDPFLQNFFGATVPKDITAASPPVQFKVLALPTQGRPKDFSGAVGSFKISSDLSSHTTAAGDPITLRMHVVGAGNFDRVDSHMLNGVSQWKTYQPKATFSPADAVGYHGEKIFEQPLIAAQSGTQTLPGLTFSYFDPGTARYETARTSPLSVVVSPSGADLAANAGQSAGGAGPSAGELSSGLRPDHAQGAALTASLVPAYLQPKLLIVPCVLALAFAGGWLGLRRRERIANDVRASRERLLSKTVHAALKQLDAAAKAGDTALFFNSARLALQQSLAARWQVPPEAVTAAELDVRLGQDGADIRQIFALADEASFSGRKLQAIDFQRWTQIVRDHLTDHGTS